jgi:hypothetical protein
MISNRAPRPSEVRHTDAVDPAAAAPKEVHSFRLSRRAELQPPHPRTLENLMSEIQDAIDRDQQFLIRGEELLARWKVIARRMQERFREVLGGDRASSG